MLEIIQSDKEGGGVGINLLYTPKICHWFLLHIKTKAQDYEILWLN